MCGYRINWDVGQEGYKLGWILFGWFFNLLQGNISIKQSLSPFCIRKNMHRYDHCVHSSTECCGYRLGEDFDQQTWLVVHRLEHKQVIFSKIGILPW